MAARGLRLLVLAPGTLGRLGNYVSGTTLFLEYLCEQYNDRVTVLSPERLWRNRGGAIFPRFEKNGHFEIFRKGLHDHCVLPEDFDYFLKKLKGRSFDVLLDMNDTCPEFRRMLVAKYHIPVVLTVEQAGVRAGLPLSPQFPQEGILSPEWHSTLSEVDAVVTWHINDIQRLEQIGDGKVPVYHIYYAVGLLRPMEAYDQLPETPLRGCSVGSLYADPGHWKRSWELEPALEILFDSTPLQEFLICGPTADKASEQMVSRLKKRYPNRIVHCFYPGDRDAAIAEIAKSAFLYNPIGGNQIGSTPVEAWATGTPLLLTGSTFGRHLENCIHCSMEDLPIWVNRIFKDELFVKKITSNGRKNYQRYFSPESMANAYRKIITDCLDNIEQKAV